MNVRTLTTRDGRTLQYNTMQDILPDYKIVKSSGPIEEKIASLIGDPRALKEYEKVLSDGFLGQTFEFSPGKVITGREVFDSIDHVATSQTEHMRHAFGLFEPTTGALVINPDNLERLTGHLSKKVRPLQQIHTIFHEAGHAGSFKLGEMR
jgi:hypothetical protein